MNVPSFLNNSDVEGLSRSLLFVLISVLLLAVSACSNTHESENGASLSAKGTTKKASKNNYIEHIHPENICFGARSHSHAGGEKEHEHPANCIQSKKGTSNAHVHPKDEKGRIIRHVHPNGASEHTHQ